MKDAQSKLLESRGEDAPQGQPSSDATPRDEGRSPEKKAPFSGFTVGPPAPPRAPVNPPRASAGERRDETTNDAGPPTLPSISKLELPKMDPNGIVLSLAARFGLQMDHRGDANASTPSDDNSPQRGEDQGPKTPLDNVGAIYRTSIDVLGSISEALKPTLEPITSRMPNVPGPLARLMLLLLVAVYTGSQIVGPSLPSYEEFAAEVQIAQAKKGAQEMAKVKQVRKRCGAPKSRRQSGLRPHRLSDHVARTPATPAETPAITFLHPCPLCSPLRSSSSKRRRR